MSNLLPGTLIERTFRERIILVGVIFPGLTEEMVAEGLTLPDDLAGYVDDDTADPRVRRGERADPLGELDRACHVSLVGSGPSQVLPEGAGGVAQTGLLGSL